MRALWPVAVAWVCGCADKAQAPEPGIEATVVEVKQVAEAEKPAPPPPPVAQVAPPPPAPPPAVHAPPKHVPKAGSAAPPPPPPDHKDPQLESNPYLYK